MREMHWTYADLKATPAGVRTYVWDCIRAERATQQAAAEKERRAQQRQAGTTVVQH